MSYTLVVIDVQPEFDAALNPNLRMACQKKLRVAKRKRADILFVEYEGAGNTYADLVEVVKDYSRAFWVEKYYDDGSQEVINAINHHSLRYKTLKVCGVNTDACVRDTVRGLSQKLSASKIKILANACYSDWNHQRGLEQMKSLPNVKIVY